MTHKTTPRHFAIFEREVRRLVKLWGLVDWEVRVRHDSLSNALATCDPRAVSRICTIRLGKTWGPLDQVTDAAVLEAARHEVAHAVTGELITVARARCVSEDELNEAIEVTARRLGRMLP